MPTTYPEEFWLIDPYAPPPVGTVLNVFYYDIIDNNKNGLINRFSNDRIDGSDIRQSYPGDTVTVTLSGGGTATVTGTTFYLADGRQVFTPTDGTTLTTATLVSTTYVSTQGSTPVTSLPPCFTPGTRILTALGPRLVETLCPGDLVITADRGAVPLCLSHGRVLSREHLADNPKHAPVVIAAGSLGPGLPQRDLTVSPQHRMLIRSAIAMRMFGQAEILVPSVKLVGMPGITCPKPAGDVRYIHLLFDHHAIVFAEAAPSESLFFGAEIHEGLNQRDIDLISSKPAHEDIRDMKPARPFVRGPRLRNLLARHIRNDKPLVAVATDAHPALPSALSA